MSHAAWTYEAAECLKRCAKEIERLKGDYEIQMRKTDMAEAEVEWLRAALEIIAGVRPAIDNLMGNADIARAALSHQQPMSLAEMRQREEREKNVRMKAALDAVDQQ